MPLRFICALLVPVIHSFLLLSKIPRRSHFSILAWKSPWTQEPGGLHTVHGAAEWDMTARHTELGGPDMTAGHTGLGGPDMTAGHTGLGGPDVTAGNTGLQGPQFVELSMYRRTFRLLTVSDCCK